MKYIKNVNDLTIGDVLRNENGEPSEIIKIEDGLVYNDRGEKCPLDRLQQFLDSGVIFGARFEN